MYIFLLGWGGGQVDLTYIVKDKKQGKGCINCSFIWYSCYFYYQEEKLHILCLKLQLIWIIRLKCVEFQEIVTGQK